MRVVSRLGKTPLERGDTTNVSGSPDILVRPPPMVVSRGTRLALDQFLAEFRTAWSRMRSRFLKLETWQSYEELAANRSQQAFQRGDFNRARELLREEAEGDRPLYDDIRQRGLDYARIRLVKEPLTEYLRYELMSYQIRAEMGENIVVVRSEPRIRLPNPDVFDLLLFDREAALVHDYGTAEAGRQTGGWLVRDPEVIEELERRTLALRQQAVPLSQYRLESPTSDRAD